MPTTRRALGAACAMGLATPAVAQPLAWPNRPIRLISPFAPGGPQDVPARYFVEYLSPRLGQPVIFDQRPGAGGALGMQHVATAQDGHSFLITSSAVSTLPAMRRDPGFDAMADLLPVTLVTESPLAMAVRSTGPAGLTEFLARARANPGRVSFGSSGIGSATHLAGALLMQRAGVELLHVPYRGTTLALNALLAGDIDCFIGDISIVMEHVRAGTLTAIAVTTEGRAALLPNVPAVGEQVPGYAVPFWIGVFAAKSTSPEAVSRMLTELAPLAAPDSELRRRMAERGSTLLLTGPAPLAARLGAEIQQWRAVVAAAGIVPE